MHCILCSLSEAFVQPETAMYFFFGDNYNRIEFLFGNLFLASRLLFVPRDKGQYTRSTDCLDQLMQPQMHFIGGNELRPDDRRIISMHLDRCVMPSDA